MKKYIMPIFLGVIFMLAGCKRWLNYQTNQILKKWLQELSASNIVESASINDKTLLKMMEMRMSITCRKMSSLCPLHLISLIHPCEFHSLTGCQGEMVNEEMDVKIIDEDGEVHVDESLQHLRMDSWIFGCREIEIIL